MNEAKPKYFYIHPLEGLWVGARHLQEVFNLKRSHFSGDLLLTFSKSEWPHFQYLKLLKL